MQIMQMTIPYIKTIFVVFHHIPSPLLTLFIALNIGERDKGTLHLYLSNGCGLVFNCAAKAFLGTFCFC